MSEKVFKLPDLGEGLTEAELVHWLVQVGDEVALDQAIAEVETAKSLVQVPSPYAGTVAQLHGQEGEEILVGAPLITITVAADAAEQAASYRDEERAGASAPATPEPDPAEASEEGSGAVLIGYGTSSSAGSRRRRGGRGKHAARQQSQQHQDAAVSTAAQPENQAQGGEAVKVVSPLVRKLAAEQGVRLTELQGSGPGGLILRADVMAAAQTQTDAPAAPQPQSVSAAAAGERDARTGLAINRVEEVRGVRKVVVEAMTTSRREIPEATVWLDIDVTELVNLRSEWKKEHGQAPTLLAFVARYVLAGLRRYPELNTRFDGSQISYYDGVNLGFAMQTERGLMVPALRECDGASITELDQSIRALTEKARSGQATPQELTSGTFTINNYGVFGVDGSAAVINHPEVAILGLGRIIDRPWVVAGELCVRKIMELTLSFDHRVCDGGTASGFLSFVADCLQDPAAAAMHL